jgi:hypothetical protein
MSTENQKQPLVTLGSVTLSAITAAAGLARVLGADKPVERIDSTTLEYFGAAGILLLLSKVMTCTGNFGPSET